MNDIGPALIVTDCTGNPKEPPVMRFGWENESGSRVLTTNSANSKLSSWPSMVDFRVYVTRGSQRWLKVAYRLLRDNIPDEPYTIDHYGWLHVHMGNYPTVLPPYDIYWVDV